MHESVTAMNDTPGTGEAAPRRRSPPAVASAPAFAQQMAAFYPYPNPQDPVVRAAETPPDKRAGATAATARPANLLRRRGGREPG